MSDSGQFRVQYPVEALDGGLNSKYEPSIIADNDSPDCLNVTFDNLGGFQTRSGISKLNTTSVGSFPGNGLFTARFNDGTEAMIGFWNGNGYRFGTVSFTTIPSAQSVWTANTRADAVMYQNLMFFGNGGSTPYKYNGTEFTRHGITAPNSMGASVSGAAGANGAQTGDVNYKVTYVNSYVVEGDVSPATTTLTLASTATVSLSALPLAPTSFGVNARRLYRRDAGTTSSYKLVTTINDNTTTTYTDSTPSASLGAVAPTDNAPPGNWKYAVTHQERIFFVMPSQPQYLYYTELGNPFVAKTTNYILISDGDGEAITGLGVHANMVVVGKDASVWLIYMPDTTPANWQRVKSNSKYGWASHYAQADYDKVKMFIGKRYNQLSGFLALAGADTEQNNVDLSATNVISDTKSDRIEPDIFSFTSSAIANSCAIEYKNKLWFSVPYSSSVNSRIYQFTTQRRDKDERNGAWVPFTYPVGFSAFTIYNGFLYGQSATANGFVYKLDTNGYSDDGTAINSYLWTKEYYGHKEHLQNWKDFRFANFTVGTLGAYYMDFSFRVDGDGSAGTTKRIYLSPGGAVWNAFTWGDGTLWGGGTVRKNATINLDGISGKRIQFKFSNQNTLNQGFHVYPFGSFDYNRKGVR